MAKNVHQLRDRGLARVSTPRAVARAQRAAEGLRADDEAADSMLDVPAAVLCAFCGQADCLGCTDEEQSSGVVAIVPWERPGATWERLWATAHATTRSADTFFSALPDGEVSPALRFAVIAELLAVGSMFPVIAAFGVAVASLLAPGLVLALIATPAMRAHAIRWVLFGLPVFALWMVMIHASHGASIDLFARRAGARPQRRRALRVGLYACGWDLVGSPLGAIVTAVTRGWAAAGEAFALSQRVWRTATNALLAGVYDLRGDAAKRVTRKAFTVVAVFFAVSLMVAGLCVAAAILFA